MIPHEPARGNEVIAVKRGRHYEPVRQTTLDAVTRCHECGEPLTGHAPDTAQPAGSRKWRGCPATCDGCGHAAHWRECRGTTIGAISDDPIACECRHRGPKGGSK